MSDRSKYRYLPSGHPPAHRRFVYRPDSDDEVEAVGELNRLAGSIKELERQLTDREEKCQWWFHQYTNFKAQVDAVKEAVRSADTGTLEHYPSALLIKNIRKALGGGDDD